MNADATDCQPAATESAGDSGAQGRVVLVTGAGGQLGSAVVNACADAGIAAIGLGHAAFDVTDRARVDAVVGKMRPWAIVHCAAWTAVDDAEAQRSDAFAVNEIGTRNVARAAEAVGA